MFLQCSAFPTLCKGSRNAGHQAPCTRTPSSIAYIGAWCSMPKLRSLAPLVRTTNTSTVPLPPKVKDVVYTTPQYRVWRATVVGRAGYRCEAVDHGHRCSRAQPEHRMYADHIVEINDGGSVLDVNNGQCLCYSHHTIKTNEVKKKRYQTIVK